VGHQISFLVLYGHFTVLFSVLQVAQNQCFRAGAGNCLCPCATLGFHLCLVGPIHVKNANSKLKMEGSQAHSSPPGLEPLSETVLVEKVRKKTGGGQGDGENSVTRAFPD
jgi:hypothetical protein